MSQKTDYKGMRRPTEPMPSSFKPFWRLLGFLAGVTLSIALVAFLVDRMVQG